jgi:hypothetical protein
MAEWEKGGCGGEWPEMPEMRDLDRSFTLLGEGGKLGEYWLDGFRDMRVSDVDEFYFLCLECGRILFNDMEAADRFLRGADDNGGLVEVDKSIIFLFFPILGLAPQEIRRALFPDPCEGHDGIRSWRMPWPPWGSIGRRRRRCSTGGGDLDILRYQLYALREKVCRGLRSCGSLRESWEVERALMERERSDYYQRIEGYCLTDENGNVYVANVKWNFQVPEGGGGRFWLDGVELGKAKSVEGVVAKITASAEKDGGKKGKRMGKKEAEEG